MKKFFISTLAMMLIFGVSSLNAAPSTGGGALTNQTKQSTTQKRATSKSQDKATSKKATNKSQDKESTKKATSSNKKTAKSQGSQKSTKAPKKTSSKDLKTAYKNANSKKLSSNAKGSKNKKIAKNSKAQPKKVAFGQMPESSSKKTTSSQTRKKANTPLAQKTKAQLRKEAQKRTFGLMPSELDKFNRSVFHAKAAAVKGARDTESALRYLPFITIINTAGFGNQLDLRGQGRLSANGIKLYINSGIVTNPLDSYHQPMPMATIIPQLIQEVNVYPGSGAVLYGSGTKGGTIDIITSKRTYPYFVVGGGYVNTTATQGNSFNAFAHATERLGTRLKVNAGLGFNQMGGPREDDLQWQGQAILGAERRMGFGQSISFDVDAFTGKIKTTPYNSLLNEEAIRTIMTSYSVAMADEASRYICLTRYHTNLTIGDIPRNAYCKEGAFDFKPSKEDRVKKGNGEIETANMRITGDIEYNSQITKNLSIELKGLYHLSQLKYDKYKMNLPYFILGYKEGDEEYFNWLLPRPSFQSNTNTPNLYLWNEGYRADGERTDWHYFDQSGSTFSENKFGIRASMDFKHGNGEFIFGVSSNYETSNKRQNTHFRQAIADIKAYHTPAVSTTNQRKTFYTLIFDIQNKTDIKAMTNAVFILENYRFNPYFSLMAGARYEMKNYDVSISDKFEGEKLKFSKINNAAGATAEVDFASGFAAKGVIQDEFKGSYKEKFSNFAFEISPVLSYSNSGHIYLRGEMGYVAPPAWAMLRRIGAITGAKTSYDIFEEYLVFNFEFEPTKLKSENYYTAELGWKQHIGKRYMPLYWTDFDINALLFSANVFYTDSSNEFYFIRGIWTNMELGNYEKSRRMGVELSAEQYFFNGALGFNESFMYLRAEQKSKGAAWRSIPYTYDFKATFGANVNISHYLKIIDVSLRVWLQNSLYGGQSVYTTEIGVLRNDPRQANENDPLKFQIIDVPDLKLDPYIISDVGVSIGLNKGAAVITAGVKNVFDTFYYDYYNNDRGAVVNENRYIIGRGRTIFVEGEWRY